MEFWPLLKVLNLESFLMGYKLYWTEEQIEAAADNYGEGVSERLREVLENKCRQIRGLENPAGLPSRFHNAFTLGELKVVEIRFNLHGREFRAISVVLHDIRKVVFHTLADKNDQERKLAVMRRSADAIEEAIREKVSRERP